MTKTKAALDHKGLEALYPAYSMAIAWNMSARKCNQLVIDFGSKFDLPIDGDALARAAAARRRNDAAWAQLHADAVELLRVNHLDANRPNR